MTFIQNVDYSDLQLVIHEDLVIAVHDDAFHLLWFAFAPFARGFTGWNHLCGLRMRRDVVLFVLLHLLLQNFGTARGRDETQERR